MADKAPTQPAGKPRRAAKAKPAVAAAAPVSKAPISKAEAAVVAAESQDAETPAQMAEASQAASERPIPPEPLLTAAPSPGPDGTAEPDAPPPPPPPPFTDGPVSTVDVVHSAAPDEMLKLAAVQLACVGMSDAAQFLRRMCIVAEASAAATLRRTLDGGKADVAASEFQALRDHLTLSVDTYRLMNEAALAHGRAALDRTGG